MAKLFPRGTKSFGGSFKGSLSSRQFTQSAGTLGRGFNFSPKFTLDVAKSYFFSAKDWEEVMTPAEVHALSLGGAYIMTAARGLVKRRKNPSDPGRPPSKWSGLLSGKLLVFAYDPWTHSVVIGPTFLSSPHRRVYTFPEPTIPATLEFGGRERVGYTSTLPSGEVLPANRVVRIAARPFMKPAEEKARPRYLEEWQNILGRTPESLAIANAKNTYYRHAKSA
jgi:hypothetical protein